MKVRKKLIEVALPLEAINIASAREKSIRHGHPSTLHLWWARRPLAAARAVIFAQMVDDPSSHPDIFRTEMAQEKERQRLFKIIEDLVKWENTTNEQVLERARAEIWQSWRSACADNVDHPKAKELFDRYGLPTFHDPFAGGGTLPLEAQRLGLEAYATDLNPVAVLINKAMIEIPPWFAGRPPVNPETRGNKDLFQKKWHGAEGLAEDVRYYGNWMREEAEKRIGNLYPKIEVTDEMANARPDLKALVGRKLTVIAWIWARTVKSPNPAFMDIDVPLASSFMLSSKPGKETYVDPIIEERGYRFTVKVGIPKNAETAKNGTKVARGANFLCIMSGTPISADYIKAEGKAGRMHARLMAIAAEGNRGRIYLEPTTEHEAAASMVQSVWTPETPLAEDPRALWTPPYGLTKFGDLFTPRQLVALNTLSDLVQVVRLRVERDAAGMGDHSSYANAIAIYMGLLTSREANYCSSLCAWSSHPKDELAKQVFGRQAIAMTWDFAETNPFSTAGGTLDVNLSYVAKVIDRLPAGKGGHSCQSDARSATFAGRVISTDPPYYDNIGYADLADYFYVWLRRSLKSILPEVFATMALPRAEELVANPYRHGSKARAEEFFLSGMTAAMNRLVLQAHPAFPVTIYYAFKQAETESDTGTASTGWETFLEAVIQAGFVVTGTWPVRTELIGNLKKNVAALASSIVLVCQARPANAPIATRREFLDALRAELPSALLHLQRGNIAPVDLAQSAIGPGMAIYTQYSKVVDVEGNPVPVRQALSLINEALDEVLAEQEGDFDADSRWAVAWFEQYGFGEGEYGVAETLSKAKNTSVSGLVATGVLVSGRGKVRLVKPSDLPSNWDPKHHPRLCGWEVVHQLIRVLEADGEAGAASLLAGLGSEAESARELAYRLYRLCERKKRPQEALSYNALVQSWPEVVRLATEGGKTPEEQSNLFEQDR